jgi:tRNA threonylcarbamoyladenosine biosynthesis protein TsaE
VTTADPVTRTVALPTAADTAALGRRLGERLGAGDLVVLSGPLGAGKTCLAAGIGEGLGVEGPVTSPTFVIAREHPPRPDGGRGVVLVHVDAYRLGGAAGVEGPEGPGAPDVRAELDDLDLDTDLTHAAVVVEWGEGLAEHLADERLLVRLERATGAEAGGGPGGDGAGPGPDDPDGLGGTGDEPRTAVLTGPARLVDV